MKRRLSILLFIVFQQAGAALYATETPNRIVEEGFVHINGIEQWISIKGDSTKPVILFLHGGPGSPISPYADAIFSNWEKDFVLVQWDQRGSGRTYGRNAPEELSPEFLKTHALSIEQMTDDGIDLANYLLNRLTRKKIILIGTSWGTVLGVNMVMKNPELFYAYIGHAQMVNPSEALLLGYDRATELARQANDHNTLETLKVLGKPPYESARSFGQLMRITKKAQRQNTMAPPEDWSVPASGFNSEKEIQHRSDGDDFSFVQFAGDKKLGISPLYTKINYLNKSANFKLPVYLVQGEQDLQTPHVLTKSFFDQLKAPVKDYFLLPKTEHEFNQLAIDTQLDILKRLILPLTLE